MEPSQEASGAVPRGVAVTVQALPAQTGSRWRVRRQEGVRWARLEIPESTFVNGGQWEGSQRSEYGSEGSKENILWFLPSQTFIISDPLPPKLRATATEVEGVPKPTSQCG